MKTRSVLIFCVTLGGCATLPVGATTSYVAQVVTSADRHAIAADASAHLATILPPARTTIVLQRSAAGSVPDPFATELREAGFGVIEDVQRQRVAGSPPQGTQLRYIVAPLETGIVLRLQYQRREDARFYDRAADGSLIVASPFTVREAVQ